MRIDLRGLSVDEVIDFIFEHPTDPLEKSWWWKVEFVLDPAAYVAQLNLILRQSATLPERYSRAQLDQGIWFLMSDTDAGLGDLLWNRKVPWAARAELIAATVDLYRDLFAKDPLDTAAHMFWDALAYDYSVPTPKNDEHRRVQDAMFSALRQILNLDAPACQRAALHGLGHLRHANTEEVVMAYLARHPTLSETDRAYALASIAGKVQ